MAARRPIVLVGGERRQLPDSDSLPPEALSGTYPISVSGNAAAATKLATARTINGVPFDGTGNITVADATKEPVITAGTTAQYWCGDKTWQTLNKSAVGLGNVDNTSDALKPISTATQAALDDKLPSSGSPTANVQVGLGIHGGYGNGNGGSADWGACLWGMGAAYDGSGANATFAVTGMYGVAWLRGTHASRDTQVGEGAYVYQAGNFKGGVGSAGIKTTGVFYGNGSGITALNASNLSAGTLPDARINKSGPTTPSFVNSFTDAGATCYWKVGGVVYVAINVDRSTTPSNDTTMFTLPAGFRPAVQIYSPTSFGQASPLVVGAARMYVTTGGAVTFSYAVGSTAGSTTFNMQGIISFPEA